MKPGARKASLGRVAAAGALLLSIVLAPSMGAQAAFSNGQAAADTLGQYDWSITSALTKKESGSLANGGFNKTGLQGASTAVDSVHHKLYVGDGGNTSTARILVYDINSDGTLVDAVPDNVLGHLDFYGTATGSNASTINSVAQIAIDTAGNRLFVVDNGHNRVLVFDVASITNGESAVNVLGSSSLTTIPAQSTTQSGFSGPLGVAYDPTGNKLFVSEGNNSRVMVFDVSSITNGEAAANVLGQDDFTTGSPGTLIDKLNTPNHLAFDDAGDRLFVADYSNSRVMVFNVSSITNGEDAVNVLGQSLFTTNDTAVTLAGMTTPRGVAYDAANTRLFVSQVDIHRVTTYNVSSITNGEDATSVLGQANFTSSTNATTAAGFYYPAAVAHHPSGITYVADTENRRVMIFNTISITNGEDAVSVLGQTDVSTDPFGTTPVFTKGQINNGPNRVAFSSPQASALDQTNHRLFVSDTTNARVLVFNLTTNDTLADYVADHVLGQADFQSIGAGPTASILIGSGALALDESGNRLFVSDSTANRVLVFDVASITNGEAAIRVLGQMNFTASSAALTAGGFDSPGMMGYDAANSRLYVSDQNNNRVLVFSVGSITNGQDAANVLGQANFTTNAAALTAAGMDLPLGIAPDPAHNRLFVSDLNNSRVQVFDTTTITNGEPAANVLGQPNFTDNTARTTQDGLSNPVAVAYDGVSNRLFVSESGNHRIVVYDVTTVTNGESAVLVLGQSNFTSGTAAAPPTASSFNNPYGIAYGSTNGRLYVSDADNNRVLLYHETALAASSGASSGRCLERISLAVPNGGESYAAGTTSFIFWGSGGCSVTGVRLTLSTDGGATYPVTIEPSAFPSGGYATWTVPDIDTAKARVKAELLGQGGGVLAMDASDADFTIRGTSVPVTEPEEPAAPTVCDAGDLIKGRSFSTVYYCSADGKRRVFPNEKTYYTHYADFSSVRIVADADLARLPLGRNMTYKPHTRLLKLVVSPDVYDVTGPGKLSLIPDEAAARSLYGTNWRQRIDDLPEALFTDYAIVP